VQEEEPANAPPEEESYQNWSLEDCRAKLQADPKNLLAKLRIC